LLFHRKKKKARTCEKGHALEESWEQCPFCAAETGNGAADAADSTPEGGRSAVVVSKKASPRALMGWLVALNGEQEGLDFRIVTGRNLIGKGAKADIVVKDAYLSERHALLEVRENGGKREHLLSDLGSKHGTFLNGKAVTKPCQLRDRDLLRLGHTELTFRSFD
jgi:hypothetical protein